MSNEAFEMWAVVELFGHSRIAGKCTEQNIAGSNMLRVDVPETKNQPPFTRLLAHGAIYAINPVDELTATKMAEMIEAQPINAWDVNKVIEKHQQLALGHGGDQ